MPDNHPCGVSSIPPKSAWEFLVRAPRPIGMLVCVLILLVRGAILPLLQHFANRPVDGVDWTAMSAMVVALGLSALRSYDKREGTA